MQLYKEVTSSHKTSLYIDTLAVAVAFFYNKEKLEFLNQTLSNLHLFAKNIQVYVFTNTSDKMEQANIKKCFHTHHNIKYQLLVPKLLGHPYFLTWSHKDVFRKLVKTNSTITHYLYLEDDILLTPENIEYYLEGESTFADSVFIPSFVRYEVAPDNKRYAIDILEKQIFHTRARIEYSGQYYYVSFTHSYQGLYLLNRKFMLEYFDKAEILEYNYVWGGIRERNTEVILFHNVPEGFSSRNLVGCMYRNDTVKLDARCLIHHLPHNYVNNKKWLARIFPTDEVITV